MVFINGGLKEYVQMLHPLHLSVSSLTRHKFSTQFCKYVLQLDEGCAHIVGLFAAIVCLNNEGIRVPFVVTGRSQRFQE